MIKRRHAFGEVKVRAKPEILIVKNDSETYSITNLKLRKELQSQNVETGF